MGVLRNGNWEKVCQVYVLENLDQTAAFRIGFPKNKCKKRIQSVRACVLFKRPEVQERIAELMAIKAEVAQQEFEVDARYVLRRLVEIDRMDVLDILSDFGDLKPIKEWPPVWRQFIQQFEVEEVFAGRGDDRLNVGLLKKIKWPDKVRNLELLGKHIDVSAFKENIGLTGMNGGPLRIISTDMSAQEAAEAYADTLND
jgi:phage terminase small subunit